MTLLLASAHAAPQLLEKSSDINENEEFFNPNPTYNYAYQVADEDSQNYIAHNEGRKDNVVTGQYSYVDPNGSLITVDYIADENGYRETRKEEPNFVQIRAVPNVRTQVVESAAPLPVRRVVKPAPPVRKIVKAVEPIVKQVVKQESGSNDNDLVARIISQLTPFIKNTVSNSLGSSTPAASARRSAPRPAPRPVPVRVPAPTPVRKALPVEDSEATEVQKLFGFGGPNNVKVTTPEFGYDFDL